MLTPPAGANVCYNGEWVKGDGETPLPIDSSCCNLSMVLWRKCRGFVCDADEQSEADQICQCIEEAIASIDLPDSAGVTQIGCVKGESKGDDPIGVVLACKDADGNLDRLVMVPLDGSANVDPYEGPFSLNCGPAVYTPVDLWVDDQESPLCGYRVYICDGEKFILNPTTCEYELLPMGIQTTPYQPTGDDVCREAQYGAYELTAGATDVATLVADILAANPLTYDLNGVAVPVEAADVNYIKITPKACGTFNSAGDEVLVDFIDVNGVAASNFIDPSDGGVDGATAIEVPVGGCAVVDVCFKKCWTKQEVAAI